MKSGAIKPPTTISTADRATAESGYVASTLKQGALFLRDKQDRAYRLSWDEPGMKTADSRRALPAGDYILTGYRIMRKATDGKDWFISATGFRLRDIVVKPGELTRIDVPETIRIQQSLAHGPAGPQVQVQIQGEGRSGLSIYRDGKRIPMRYRVCDSAGQEMAKGDINYG